MFQQALMTFEDEKLDLAITSLKATQKLCNSADQDLVDNLKNRFRKKVTFDISNVNRRFSFSHFTLCFLFMQL